MAQAAARQAGAAGGQRIQRRRGSTGAGPCCRLRACGPTQVPTGLHLAAAQCVLGPGAAATARPRADPPPYSAHLHLCQPPQILNRDMWAALHDPPIHFVADQAPAILSPAQVGHVRGAAAAAAAPAPACPQQRACATPPSNRTPNPPAHPPSYQPSQPPTCPPGPASRLRVLHRAVNPASQRLPRRRRPGARRR